MGKEEKKGKDYCCEQCIHCIPVGEGDHLCEEENVLVLEGYAFTGDYAACGGMAFAER
ncbi:hypothetical protein LI221_05510 [Faecalimonas umbilicata]|nr:hypothetical protein [Faecalimonas umbilicata]